MSWFLGWFSNSLSQYNLTESWLSQYQISGLSAEDFFQVNAKTPLPLNVHEIEDQKMLTRYMVQTTDIKDATEEAELVKSSWLGIFVVERAKRAKPLSTLNEFTPLPLSHKALLHRYKGPNSGKKWRSSVSLVLGSKFCEKVTE